MFSSYAQLEVYWSKLPTSASKLGSFHYRIFHRKTGANLWLMATGVKDRDERFLRSREHIPKQEIVNN